MLNDWLHRDLEESRARGFLGPGDIDPQISHSLGFAECWNSHNSERPRSFVDLGSGGGLPSLVLLEHWACRGVLVDSMQKRIAFLREVLRWDGAPEGGEIVQGRAEEVGRSKEFTQVFDLVTARSFGPPAVVAESAARFLRLDGLLIVSEPPNDDLESRWNSKGLDELGLESVGRERYGSAYQVIRKVRPTPPKYPRSIGVPGKNPLF